MRISLSDLLDTPIPERLARRPRDHRGFPIPATALIRPDGTPDFRVTDIRRWTQVVNGRLCAMCGEPLGSRIAFIGGPRSHEYRLFTDPGMHLECAQTAMRICPYLAMPNSQHTRKLPAIEGVELRVNDDVLTSRPEKFFIGVTKAYQVGQLEGGSLVVQAGEWERVEWHEPPAAPPGSARR